MTTPDIPEMIERVAIAIKRAALAGYFTTGSDGMDGYKHVARAAIEAMREPTEAMVRAGCGADIPGGQWGEPTFRESSIDENDCPVIWAAMLDAALK